MQFGAKTDIGKVRELNEDSFGCKENLFVVADGMGGHRAGEVASSIAVETVLTLDLATASGERLRDIILKANGSIMEEMSNNPELSGMGTTIAALLVLPDQAVTAHIGDSRIYQFTAMGELIRLTADHSLVAELIRNGELTEAEARNHPQRNMLTRALGTQGKLEIEIHTVPRMTGDKFLICSDGLTTMVEEPLFQEILAQDEQPQYLAEQLVALAIARGGLDNVTVVVVSV